MSNPVQEQLLAHKAFLDRLARRLVADEASAQDLVQETWLVALTRPPRETDALRSWLATVARRLVFRGERTKRRREARETVRARPEADEEGLAAVDRKLDAQALLVDALRSLPEAQRLVVHLRYAEDLGPQAISERLRISVNTVKARLRRGLEALRQDLDGAHDGDRSAWALALLPGLDTVAEAAAQTAVLTSASALAGKGIAMATLGKMGIAATVALAAFGAWMWLGDGSAQVAEARDAEVSLVDEPLVAPVDPPLVSEQRIPAQERSVLSAAPTDPAPPVTPRWLLALTIEGDLNGAPAEVVVRGQSDSFGWPESLTVSHVFDTVGTEMLDVTRLFVERRDTLVPLELVIDVAHPTCAPVELQLPLDAEARGQHPPDEPFEATVRLATGAVVVGRAAPAGKPAERGVVVYIYPLEDDFPAAGRSTVCTPAEDGSFRFVLAHAGPYVVVSLAPGHRPSSQEIEVTLGSIHDVGALAPEPGAEITGYVVRGGDVVGKNHRVSVKVEPWQRTWGFHGGSAFVGRDLTWIDRRIEWAVQHGLTDDDGHVRFSGLAPSDYHIECLSSYEHKVSMGFRVPRHIVLAPARDVEIGFGAATLEVLVEGTDASAGGVITIERDGTTPYAVQLEEPRLALSVPPETDMTFVASFEGFEDERVEVRVPAAGEHLEVPLLLREQVGVATLVIELEGAVPPSGTVFLVHDLARGRHTDRANDYGGRPQLLGDPAAQYVPAYDGKLVIENQSPGEHHYLVYAAESPDRRSTMALDVEIACTLSPGERRTEQATLVLGGTLRLDVRDADGRRAEARCKLFGPEGLVPLTFVAHHKGGSVISAGQLSPQGPNDVHPNLAPGTYTLRLELDDHAPHEETLEILPGERTDASFQLRR